MDSQTDHWVEILTGLAATGVDAVVAVVNGESMQGHPLVPVLQITDSDALAIHAGEDIDLVLGSPADAWPAEIAALLQRTLSGGYTPMSARQRNVDLQITRGRMGISL